MVSLDLVANEKKDPTAYKKTSPQIHFVRTRRTIPAKIMGIPTPWSSLFQPEVYS
jgi:hypothetical protein